jgi:hypothetical protein
MTSFEFFRFFSKYLDLKRLKNDQIYIQMIKFVFKPSNLNLNGPIKM